MEGAFRAAKYREADAAGFIWGSRLPFSMKLPYGRQTRMLMLVVERDWVRPTMIITMGARISQSTTCIANKLSNLLLKHTFGFAMMMMIGVNNNNNKQRRAADGNCVMQQQK